MSADALRSDRILEVRDVTVSFDMERGSSTVLDEASLDIHREEILGIVGESGSGKSMLADSLLDAVVEPGRVTGDVRYYPDDGGPPVDVLELDDEELSEFRWETMSMVFQGAMSSWNPTMKLRNHFEETIEAHDTELSEGMARAYDLLSELYLDAERVLNSYPHELSGGMKQRALIALALVLEPDVLVMDEPTASLDLLMQRSIINLLNDLQDEYGLTMVFISHNLPLVANLSDRIAVLYAFQLAEVGPTEDIIRNASHPYTRLLLESTPNLDAPLDEMTTIEGSTPDPINIPDGCRFHTRCPLATELCANEDPAFRDVDADHEVACHHWEDAAGEIPVSFDYEEQVAGASSAAGRAGEPVLELDDVTIEFDINEGVSSLFGGTSKLQAVDGATLDVYENDVVAVVGESGCGKTTLGKALIGIHRPTEGSVTYRGQDVWASRDGKGDVAIPWSDIRLALQMIHQDPGSSLNPNKRIRRTLSKPLTKMHPDMSREEQYNQIMTMLEQVGMTPPEDYADRYPHQLSGGEKQRIALIRALFMNPDVILADEAVSALDVSLRVEMMDLFLELQEVFDTSFVFISHDLSNARYLAEKADGRIAVMYLGEIVEIGPAAQVIQNPQHPYTQALIWATPDLDADHTEGEELPVESIDIPDPADPPSGCSFHTRCPEAREACTEMSPEGYPGEDGLSAVSCFRADSGHEYWDSDPLWDEEGEEEEEIESAP